MGGRLIVAAPSAGSPDSLLSANPVPPKRLASAAYASGSLGTGVFSTVPAILLLYFCTETLRIPAAWAALIVFVPKVWAIFWDPMVGIASDRAVTPWGRRRPFMLVGATGMAAGFIAVFSPPLMSIGATIAWMMIAYFFLATLYSLFAVPYVAIPSEIAPGETARSRLVSWRMFVAMLGVLAGAGLVPQVVDYFGGGRVGYHRMSLLIAVTCWVAMLIPLGMLRGRDAPNNGAARSGVAVSTQIAAVVRHRPFLYLCLAYMLQLTAVGVISASAPYLITGALHRGEGDIGTAMIGMLATTTLTIPLWAWSARHVGAARSLIFAILLFAAGALWIGSLCFSHGDWLSGRIAFAFTGVGFAGMQVLPYTLVATLIHHAASSAAAGESSFTGAWTAAEKLGLAFGPALTGVVLSIWPAEQVSAVSILVIAAPLLLGLLSMPLLLAATRSRA
jgi:glycoside/pentoside/hexuronide:cation symporter, GPH family